MTALEPTTARAPATGRTHALVMIGSAPVLGAAYWYFGQAHGFGARFGDWYGALYQFAAMFVLMGALPALYVRLVWRRPLGEFGVRAGDWRFGLRFVAVIVPLVVVPIAYLGSRFADVRGEYPLARTLFARRDLILWYELAYIALYYVAWEFYFRGALLFGAERIMGAWPAILVQTTSSCLIHLGKPPGETFGSILFGIALGWLALRTRSVVWGLVIHVSLGVLADLFVIFLPA